MKPAGSFLFHWYNKMTDKKSIPSDRKAIYRFIVGFVAIPAILVALYFGHIYFFIFCLIVAAGMSLEFHNLVRKAGPATILGLTLPFTLLVAFDVYFLNGEHVFTVLTILVLLTFTGELFRRERKPLQNIPATIIAAIYPALFMFYVYIRETVPHDGWTYNDSGRLLIVIFVSIWVCDTFAYIIGSLFGKRKLAPGISPKKTVEGAAAGFLASMISVFIFSTLLMPAFNLIDIFIIGLIIGIAGQAGDLVESLFKREADLKDSSNIIPGHGGFLDRFDSSLFIAPMLYLYLYYFSG